LTPANGCHMVAEVSVEPGSFLRSPDPGGV
jgi:hypothetical protein